jgi:hypothetical protein
MMLSQRLQTRIRSYPPKIVPFAGWTPDRPPFGSEGATVATNVFASESGFRPLPALNPFSDALDARPQGAAAGKDSAGNISFFAGDASKLYSLVNNSFADVSKSGGYSTSDDGTWEFAQFGSRVIATNFDDAVQSYTLGTSSAFADLFTSTNKPKARHGDVVLDFYMMGNTSDTTDGAVPNRVWWTALNNVLDADPSASTQADYQDIPDGGWVQRILGGFQYALVFLETQVQRLYYVGSPLIFDRDPIDRQRGTFIPNSVIGYGALAGFISEEGFMATAGGEAQAIGNNAVDREFLNQFDRAHIARVSSAYDPVSKVMLWAFPGTGHTAGQPNVIFLVHLPTMRWSKAEVNVELILRTMQQGYTLDGLDAVSTDLDALAFSLDSRAWTAGNIKMGAFSTLYKLGFFDGSNLAATIETADYQPNPAGRSRVFMTRPLVDGGTPTSAVASRDKLTDTATFGSAATMNLNGSCTLLSEGRYHRARVTVPAASTWTHAQGVEMHAREAGGR